MLVREDAGQISRLNKLFYGVEREHSFWEWKYFQIPTKCHLMAVAEKDGEIVGQLGCIALYMQVGGTRQLVGQTQDILILKEYRKGFTFVKLEKATRSIAEARSAALYYGFSIEMTRNIATRLLSFTDVTPIWKMVLPLNPTPYLENKIKSKALCRVISALVYPIMKRLALPTDLKLVEGMALNPVERFDARFDMLWERVKNDHCVILERSSDYLNWRYTDHPEVDYAAFALSKGHDILGFIVCEIKQGVRRFSSLDVDYKDTRRGEIIDILVADDAEADRAYDLLLRRAFGYFIDHEVDVISCWCQPHMAISRHLSRYRFRQRWTPHRLIVQSESEVYGPDSRIFKPESWYLMRGDSDHY